MATLLPSLALKYSGTLSRRSWFLPFSPLGISTFSSLDAAPVSHSAEFLFPPFVRRHAPSGSVPRTKPRLPGGPARASSPSQHGYRSAPEVPPWFWGGLCHPTLQGAASQRPHRCCDLYGPTHSDTPTHKSRSLPSLPSRLMLHNPKVWIKIALINK